MPHGRARNGSANATAALLLIVGLTLGARTSEAQGVPVAIRQAIDAGAYASAESLAVKWATSVDSDPLQRLRAQDLLVESLVRNGKAASSSTVILARRVLRDREHRLGRVHVETAQSLHTFGLVRAARGEFAQAIPLFDRALAIRRMALGPEHPLVADTLDQLAAVLIQLERFPDAKVRLDASMRIREAGASRDDLGLSRTLGLVGTLYRYAGPYADALAPLERALAIRARRTPQHPETASLLQVRGDVLFLRGDSTGAQRLWSTALAMAERTLGDTHPSIAEFLRRLGFASFSAGNLTEARRLRERALRIGERTHRAGILEAGASLVDANHTIANLVDAKCIADRFLEVLGGELAK